MGMLGEAWGLGAKALRKKPEYTKEQWDAAIAKEKHRVMTEEMGMNDAMARQVADGDIPLANARVRADNQGRRLGTGKEDEALSDIDYIQKVQDADPEGIQLYEWKQSLPPELKEAVTDAEILYKKGNPKPLANVYRAMAAGFTGLSLSEAALSNTHIKPSGHIQAPRSGGMFDLTMGLRDLGRRLQGSPAQLVNPDGVAQYLETVNRRTENPNAETRLFAALDFL